MSRKRSGPRSKSSLSETLDRRLKMYSLAASAAGVSILALALPADAEVVVTAKNLTVVAGSPVYIEMTGVGKANVEIVANSSRFYEALIIAPLPGGEAAIHLSPLNIYDVSRLVPGAIVGPQIQFDTTGNDAVFAGFYSYTVCFSDTCVSGIYFLGVWPANGSSAYLGLKFGIAGHIHYGWVRLSVTSLHPVAAKITAYGYETEPDTPIVVPPVPPDDSDDNTKQEDQNVGKAYIGGRSLGMLALGAHELPRREESLTH
jgi:hypothetical protein